jgi:GAF domain-containing protein
LNWLANPLLPETRSELAVPIASGNLVLGVMDVQHNIYNGLSEADSSLLLSIANQVGVALQNSRLYAKIQSQANRDAQANSILQRIQTATTVDDVLQMAVSELGSALGVEKAKIELSLKQDGRR